MLNTSNRSIGFSNLTNKEQEVIKAFNEYKELVLPDFIEQGNKTLHTLANKGIVNINKCPFTLTAKGQRIYNNLLPKHPHDN